MDEELTPQQTAHIRLNDIVSNLPYHSPGIAKITFSLIRGTPCGDLTLNIPPDTISLSGCLLANAVGLLDGFIGPGDASELLGQYGDFYVDDAKQRPGAHTYIDMLLDIESGVLPPLKVNVFY